MPSYSEDVKKRFDRAQFNVEKFKSLTDIKHIPILKKKELIFLQTMGPRLGGLLTKDIGELKRIFLSPGPIFDPEDRMDDYWGYTEAFYSVGFRPGDAVQVTFNYHLAPADVVKIKSDTLNGNHLIKGGQHTGCPDGDWKTTIEVKPV